jgi:hypothetical protein
MIMEKEKQIPSDVQLLARWVTMLANKLQYHKMLTQSDAFKQAHLTRDLLTALGEGEVEFTYRKEDGFIRKARGTLCKGVCPGYDSYQPKTDRKPRRRDEEDTSYCYFDIDRNEFRSFKAENVMNIDVIHQLDRHG